jgi:hypothetical protein
MATFATLPPRRNFKRLIIPLGFRIQPGGRLSGFHHQATHHRVALLAALQRFGRENIQGET